jgi:hypothetical protein
MEVEGLEEERLQWKEDLKAEIFFLGWAGTVFTSSLRFLEKQRRLTIRRQFRNYGKT